VRNATPEPGLAADLEEALRMSGGFRKSSSNELSITVSRFTESVDSIGSSGLPVRQKLTMDIAWKVEGSLPGQATFGSKTVNRTYPYSAVPSTLDWNRGAAIHLLTEMAAREILNELGLVP
jgi:hypothetical protein